MYRTQKARGLKALKDSGEYPMPNFMISSDLENVQAPCGNWPKFARPCPVTPRHGFVDSRPVNNMDEVRAVFAEAKAVDPDAELIVMSLLDAKFNAIATTGSVSIGPGHDGATSGHDALTIPTLGELIADEYTLREATITDTPYVELVYAAHKYDEHLKPYYVQLRNGPQVSAEADYIPGEVEVKAVVKAEGDLLEWEAKVKAFAPGTAVYHPGGCLSSHYAVHCALHSIPVLTSREPVVGEVLKPTSKEHEPDIRELQVGFRMAVVAPLNYSEAVYTMLAGLHHTALWQGRFDRLLGFAAGCAYRLAYTACLGEARHHNSKWAGNRNRSIVFHKAWTRSFVSRAKLGRAAGMFMFEDWLSGYGGEKWATIANYAIDTFNAVFAGDYTGTLEAFNLLTNSVHNNSWTFDKFVERETLNEAAQAPVKMVVKIAPVLYMVARATDTAERIRKVSITKPTVPPAAPEPKVVAVQVKVSTVDSSKLHVQAKYAEVYKGKAYKAFELDVPTWVIEQVTSMIKDGGYNYSFAGSDTKYMAVHGYCQGQPFPNSKKWCIYRGLDRYVILEQEDLNESK